MKYVGLFLALISLGSPIAAQSLEVTPERDRATVGDSIPLRVRARIQDTDQLLDSVPQLLGQPPRGIRVLSSERVIRQPDRTFVGRIVAAFYRPGRQSIPPFALTYRRGATVLNATLRSEPVDVDIVPVLPGGSSPRLQDIKDLEPTPRVELLPLGLVLAAVVALGVLAVRRRRTRPVAQPQTVALSVGSGAPNTALATALEQLGAIERERWPARGEVARHYEAVTNVLRDYLAEVERLPARERTTAEVLRMLPPSLTPNGVFERCRGLLSEADLVKFAGVRPDVPAADRFLGGARALLGQWGKADAVR